MNLSPLDLVMTHFPDAVEKSGKYLVRCPCHDDESPSLSIEKGDDGRVLIYCFAGCKTADVLAVLGLKMSDIMPQSNAGSYSPLNKNVTKIPAKNTSKWEEVSGSKKFHCAYNYTDTNGAVLYRSVRMRCQKRNTETGEVVEGKTFYQQRKAEPGERSRDGFISNMKGVSFVLYDLLSVLAAIEKQETIWITEGEKDAENMKHRLGLVATTNVGGAGKWKEEYNETLRGGHIVLLCDNDATGKKHMADVAASVQGSVTTVRILELPGLPDKGDVSDWIGAGRTADELRQLAKDTPLWEKPVAPGVDIPPPMGSAPDGETDRFHTTDLGNAERLILRHGQDLRYCPGIGWLVWNGKKWQADESGEVMRRAKDTVRHIFTCAARLQKSVAVLTEAIAEATGEVREELKNQQSRLASRAKELNAWAFQSEAAARLEAAITLAKTEKGVYVAVTDLDANPLLLNCQNGTLDLRTQRLLPHNRPDLITRSCRVNYKADAPAPLWSSCMERWQPSSETRAFLQRAGGYTLSGLTGEECAFFSYGTGRNGKSKFIGALEFVMGGYAERLRVDVLMESRRDTGGTTPDLVDLPGVRLVIVSEMDASHRLREALLKDLTGNERISVNPKHQKVFKFHPVFKLWMYGNHKPTIRGTDEGIRRRLPLIPFAVTVPKSEVDIDLKAKLESEGEGILAWFVRGFAEYQKGRLAPPSEVLEATSAYHAEQDTLKGFFDTCCVFHENAWTPTAALRKALEEYCDGEGIRPPNPNEVGARLTQERCISKIRRYADKSARGWEGVGLVASEHEEPVYTVNTRNTSSDNLVQTEKRFLIKEDAENAVTGVYGVNKLAEGRTSEEWLAKVRATFEGTTGTIAVRRGRVAYIVNGFIKAWAQEEVDPSEPHFWRQAVPEEPDEGEVM